MGNIDKEHPGRSFHPIVGGLIDSGDAIDSSWHNDVAPSVSWYDPENEVCRVRLWDDDPDPSNRESRDMPRFSVMLCATDSTAVSLPETVALYSGENARAAADCYRKMVGESMVCGVGLRVAAVRAIDRYPHCLLAPGTTGTVVRSDDYSVGILLDSYESGLDDWHNVLWYYNEDRHRIADDLRIVPSGVIRRRDEAKGMPLSPLAVSMAEIAIALATGGYENVDGRADRVSFSTDAWDGRLTDYHARTGTVLVVLQTDDTGLEMASLRCPLIAARVIETIQTLANMLDLSDIGEVFA